MYQYEYSVTLEQQGDIWYYTVAQEINGKVEFLGWGYTEDVNEASDHISRYIKEQFDEYAT